MDEKVPAPSQTYRLTTLPSEKRGCRVRRRAPEMLPPAASDDARCNNWSLKLRPKRFQRSSLFASTL